MMMDNRSTIQIKLLDNREDLAPPKLATPGSVGYDLRSAAEGEIVLQQFVPVLIPTGIAICLPRGWEGQVRPRSGLALKEGITVLNSPGTIDSDYNGEIKVCLIKLTPGTFRVARGMKIAQMVVAKCVVDKHEIVDALPSTTRGDAGFGSTGLY